VFCRVSRRGKTGPLPEEKKAQVFEVARTQAQFSGEFTWPTAAITVMVEEF